MQNHVYTRKYYPNWVLKDAMVNKFSEKKLKRVFSLDFSNTFLIQQRQVILEITWFS